MKHLERAKRMLAGAERLASKERKLELKMEKASVLNPESVGIASCQLLHRQAAMDAEFLQELLREYINKWEVKT